MKKLFTTLSVLLMAAATMAQVPNYVPTNGLVGYWSFDGNADDQSANGNDGTVYGATLVTDRFGNSNAAYGFDGVDDYIEIPDNPDYAFGSDDFSISYWVNKQDSTNSVNAPTNESMDNGFDLSMWDTPTPTALNDWTVGLTGLPNANRLRFVCASGTTNYVVEGTTGMSQFLNQWVMVTVCREGANLRLYLSGSLEGTLSIGSVVINNNTLPLYLATFKRGTEISQWFSETKLDDIGIWNRALTNCEIQQLYESELTEASVTPQSATTFCQGGFVELTASGGTSYQWSTGAMTQSITVSQTGNYSVIVTNNNCSDTSDPVSVTVNSLPNVGLSGFNPICENSASLTLSGGSPSGGSYTVNGTPSTELNPSVTGSGMQTVAYEYTDNNGCSNTATQTVMVNQSPSVSVSGLNTAYTPTDPAVQLNGTPSGGVYSGSGVTNDGVFDPAVAGVGTHNVQYVYVDGNGCIGVDGLCTSVDMSMNIGGSNIDTDGGTIDVYPNPSNGLFSVSVDGIEGIINMIVYDSRGREIVNESTVSNGQKSINDIDLNNYSDGVYTLQLSSKSGNYTTKLVKK